MIPCSKLLDQCQEAKQMSVYQALLELMAGSVHDTKNVRTSITGGAFTESGTEHEKVPRDESLQARIR